jgi:hypothetical protein
VRRVILVIFLQRIQNCGGEADQARRFSSTHCRFPT